MNRIRQSAVLAAAAMSLTACGDHDGGMVNAKICANFKVPTTAQSSAPAVQPSDAAAPVDECVRRWAYSLAGARDSAEVVAGATVAACGPALIRWNQAGLTQQAQATADAADQPLSLTTGQPTTPLAEHSAFAHDRALFYVIQARAGRCAPPPVSNGVPVGI